MNIIRLLVFGMVLVALNACSNRHMSSVLVERGVKQYERDYFATKESMGVEKRLKDIFQLGYIEEGMNQEMVNLLWGPPDREINDGEIWEYYSEEGKLITRLIWGRTDKPRMKGYEDELVLKTIEGDRYGGSPPPQTSHSAY
ncbi:MAG: hypothetical protein LBR60_07580 [Fibrobacter sp.]|jgi:hypothetical protein|nr:hypothetical protein [Fibrobacter sp.]